jgi:polyphosphate glucokinase
MADSTKSPHTLAIDIGGTGLKMMTLGPNGEPLNERHRQHTPEVPTPGAVLAVLETMIASQPEFDRVSVGFPGVVHSGVTETAVNLHPDWRDYDLAASLERLTGKPTHVANDADVQGLAVIESVGVELVITLGTGIGSALYVNGQSVSNLELAHHPFRKDKTYEQCLGNAALQSQGKTKWNRRLEQAIALLDRTINYRMLYLGGGNTKKIKIELPTNVQMVPNVAGLLGGIRLWKT